MRTLKANFYTKITKDKRITNRYLLFKLGCIMITALLFAVFIPNTVKAASGLKIYNYTTKKTSTYTGKQVKVTYNKTTVSNSKTPGILVNGVAMVPYDDVFQNSKIAATCKYDSSKGTITISKYDKTFIMKIGSKKATLNGKTVTLSVAPMKIKYSAANKIKILVPSRYISETLGFKYTWTSSKSTVAIEKGTLRLSYNGGKAFEYSSTQGKVTVDGKSVNLGNMPSIISNNTAMLQAKKVFGSTIKADYKYSGKDKSVTISKGNNVIKMTIGSKKAYVNNKAVWLSAAPILVKNFENNTTYVMVPGEFTATSLGYGYKWNNSTKTSMITSRKDTDIEEDDPELGDSDVINDKGTILYEWKSDENNYGKSSEIYEVSGNSTTETTGNIYNVTRDYTHIKQNAETFQFFSTSPYGKVKASHSGNVITLEVEDLISPEQLYSMFGVSSAYVNTISITPNDKGTGTTVKLELLLEDYQYDISLSADQMILYLTVYKNTVTQATIGVNSAGDYLTLTGSGALKATITKETNYMYIDLPKTANGIQDVISNISGTKYIKQFYSIGTGESNQFMLILEDGYDYYILESGNQYTISFQKAKTTETKPDLPTDQDKSKYEIVIPRPAGLTDSMVSDEDFYLSNYFEIRLAGNYANFFNSNPITYNSSVIKKITVTANGSKETIIKISTSKLQGYEIAADSNNLYINIGDPKEIYKNIVVLDPGHGGGATGAMYYGTKEKDVNFKILYTIGKQFFNSDTSKLKVYYTRTSDVDITLDNRAAFAKSVGADLFVSLHMNAATASVSGTEVYYSKNNNKANKAGLNSYTLGTYFQNVLTKNLGTKSRGVKDAGYVVVKKNTVPAVLIELGFLSNKAEHANLTNEAYQTKAVKLIYDTILQVFEDYPTGR